MDTPLIHVTGDHIVHWLQQVGSAEATASQNSRDAWDRATFFRLQARPWGAALIAEILREAAEARREDDRAVYGFRVTGNTLRQSGVGNTENRNVARDFSMWREDKHGIWRMHQFLLRAQASDAPFYPDGKPDFAPACLIIDDAEGRFRTHFRESLEWFESPDLCPKNVILKTISPLPESSGVAAHRSIPLWDYLRGRYAEILTVYCKADNLRESGFGSVGRSLSWEQIALDVLDAINATACGLKAAQRVVVSLGLEGAVVTERGLTAAECATS